MSRKLSESFMGSVSILALSNIAVQSLAILTFPITSRLFSPSAFGYLAVFVSISAILSNMASLRYEMAVMLPKDDSEAADLMSLSFFIILAISVTTAIAVFIYGRYYGVATESGSHGHYLWMLPAVVFFTGNANLFRYWHMRMKSFKEVAVSRFASKLVNVGSLIGFGVSGFIAGFFLILSTIMTTATEAVLYMILAFRNPKARAGSRLSLRRMTVVMKKYSKFPLYTSWSDLLNTASQSVPILMISTFFGSAASGHYSRALALVHLPFFFLSTSIRDVFYQRISAKISAGEDCAEFAGDIFHRLIGMIFLPMCMLAVISTDIFVVYAGHRWYEAGVYTRYLLPWFCVGFVSYPSSVLFMVLNKQDTQLKYNFLLFAARVAALAFGGFALNDVGLTIILFSAVGATFNAWMLYYLLGHIGVSAKRLVFSSAFAVISAIPFIALAAAGKWLFGFPAVVEIFFSTLISLVYFALLIHRDDDVREFIGGTVKSLAGKR